MLDRASLVHLLEDVANSHVSARDAAAQIATAPFEDLGYAKPDLQRALRTGAAEVIYGEGKTAQQIAGIACALASAGQETILVTRVDADKVRDVLSLLEDDGVLSGIERRHHEEARLLTIGKRPEVSGNGQVVVACAGTSDLYCAEEAAITAEMMGSEVCRLYDVGVAGIHRLLAHVDVLQQASAVVAVAGMEGALASVIGGLAPCPVIAVPTSVGYGVSFGGLTALLSMLSSCSSGTSVVNIDNGFGAGFQAALIDHAQYRRG